MNKNKRKITIVLQLVIIANLLIANGFPGNCLASETQVEECIRNIIMFSGNNNTAKKILTEIQNAEGVLANTTNGEPTPIKFYVVNIDSTLVVHEIVHERSVLTRKDKDKLFNDVKSWNQNVAPRFMDIANCKSLKFTISTWEHPFKCIMFINKNTKNTGEVVSFINKEESTP